MRIKYLISAAIGLAICANPMAQPAYEVNGNEIIFSADSQCMRIQMCNDHMFRVTKSLDSSFRENETWMVVKYEFDPVAFSLSSAGDQIEIETSSMKVLVEASPWRIKVYDSGNVNVYEEKGAEISSAESPCNICVMQADEHFFGFGERMDQLDQRGQKIHLNVELGKGPKPAVGGKDILRANYCPVPFFMSSRGYAIFFHNATATDWDMGWSDIHTYSFSASGGELDYYFILGPEFETMLHSYQELTGTNPMMPRSAYGLHIGSYSGGTWKHEECTSDQYPIDLVHRLRSEGVPFDLLWLDSTWRYFNTKFGNGGCSFEFRNTFKNPQAMIDSVYANHVDMFGLHIRSIIDNGVHTTLFDDALEAGVIHPKADSEGIINFFDPQSVDWWWEHGVMKVASMGVKFLKTDCGGSLRFADGTTFVQGPSADERHNLFPIAYAKAPYEKFQEYNNQRGFNHTREGYAGIQRYPFIWAGDWGTEWQWFEPVIRGGLNIGLSGVGNWSHCMGGFEQYSPYDTDLYIRWCQFGMFSPVSILFGMDHPRYHEPWTYGEEALATFIKYDKLRYSLIPYIYSNAYRMYATSRPLMTPLLYDYPNDELTYQLVDQYLFGTGMMICPVTVKGALSRPVYFPGGKWVDFWTGERIEGRQHKSFLTPPDLMPIFIRQGAIIPKQPVMQYMTEKPVDEITLAVYPVGQSSYDLYEDDGHSLDYQKGVFSLTHIESMECDGKWTLTIPMPEGDYKPSRHTYRVEAWWDTKPVQVMQNGKLLGEMTSQKDTQDQEGWYYDGELRILHIKSDLSNEEAIQINVE